MNTTGGYENSAPLRRIGIFKSLRGNEVKSVSELARSANTSVSVMSRHIWNLSDQGIVHAEGSTFHNYQYLKPVGRDDELFKQTVPGKAGLATLYENVIEALQNKPTTSLNATAVRNMIVAASPEYARLNQEGLTNRISVLLRWLALHQPDSLRATAPSAAEPHTKVSLNPSLVTSTNELLNAVEDAVDPGKVDLGVRRALQFTSDSEKVTSLIIDVYENSPRTRPA